MLSGCGTAVSTTWRSEAQLCLTRVLAAGAGGEAPEETENIRETILLADRFQRSDLVENAEQLYLLSSQKCQLLLRSLSVATRNTHEEPSRNRLHEKLSVIPESHVQPAALLDEEYVATSKGAGLEVVVPAGSGASRFPKTHGGIRKIRRPVDDPLQQVLSPAPLRRLTPSATTIYLTFDDGPSHLTLPIASYLNSEGVQATFFVLGSNIKGREKAITETVGLGHRVGNHTFSHDLKKLKASSSNETNEIRRAGLMIDRLGGDGKMVRIPYGASGAAIATQVAVEGAQVFEWDINSKDSTLRGVRDRRMIENSVLKQLYRTSKKHVVVLFHDGAGHDSTLAALKDLIPRLKREGYRFGVLTRKDKVAGLSGTEKRIQ